MYFAHAIGALSGSALIDEPVFAYRIHGGNIYTQRAQLDRTLCFKPGSAGDSNARARLVIVDHLVAQASRFAPNVWLRLYLVALLIRLDLRDPRGAARLAPAARAWPRRWSPTWRPRATVSGPWALRLPPGCGAARRCGARGQAASAVASGILLRRRCSGVSVAR